MMNALCRFMEPYTSLDSLFTVNRFHTRFYRQDMSPINHDPDNLVRTQGLELYFEENSCLYLFRAKVSLRPVRA